MNNKKSYAVLGLGRFGKSVAIELALSGAEVLAVDKDSSIVNDMSLKLPNCKCADITDKEVVNQLGLSNMDVIIIAMANSVESTVLAIMLCKEAGAETIIVKCANEMHKKIYEQMGADKVLFPENESGVRLAKNLLSYGFIDMFDISDDISMVELDIKESWIGKTLSELDFRKKYSLNVVAEKRGSKVNMIIDPNKPLEKNMKLIVIADTTKLNKLK